ncbi:MAG: fibronectin type III domain-containing protein [Verrucomicrobia bacterium]|nr:fibronectin type III domain-containing protein [Verrucomicrobiota bacterium]
MKRAKVLVGFTHAPDPVLVETARGVLKCMTGNPAFPEPPVTMLALEAAINEFSAGLAAQFQGGTMATTHKKNTRDALVALLRRLAAYVQASCNGDLAPLLSSGFQAATPSRARQPLDAPGIPRLTNGNSGQLMAKIKPVPNAKCYETRYAVVRTDGAVGPFQFSDISADSRAIALNNLTPGTLYEVQIRAVGGSTGYSGWSDPTQHRCM